MKGIETLTSLEQLYAQENPNGKKLIINAPANSKDHKYVQSINLNGQPINKNWIGHKELLQGGQINWIMGKEPNKKRGVNKSAYPYSFSDEYPELAK
ncbi:MAG: glycoside hydrolase domain-containing protein [Ginsengibacter sp.]